MLKVLGVVFGSSERSNQQMEAFMSVFDSRCVHQLLEYANGKAASFKNK